MSADALHDDEEQALRAALLRALARREHSRLELMQKFKSYNGELLERLLDEFAAKGWQSDARFAEAYVREAVARGKGSLSIRHALQEKGVSELPDFFAEIDWLQQCREVYRKKYAALPDASLSWAEQSKRMRFLAQRGFDSETVRAAFKYD